MSFCEEARLAEAAVYLPASAAQTACSGAPSSTSPVSPLTAPVSWRKDGGVYCTCLVCGRDGAVDAAEPPGRYRPESRRRWPAAPCSALNPAAEVGMGEGRQACSSINYAKRRPVSLSATSTRPENTRLELPCSKPTEKAEGRSPSPAVKGLDCFDK